MADSPLTGQPISTSYEQVLHVNRDGGGWGSTTGYDQTKLVDVADGAVGTIFAFKMSDQVVQLTSSNRLQFRDSDIYISSPSDGQLDIEADGSINILGPWTTAGQTCADLGTVLTADINGGTIDGVTIGASVSATLADVIITTMDCNAGSMDGVEIGDANPTTGIFTTLTVNDQLVINAGASIIGDTVGEVTLNIKGVNAQTNSLLNVEINDGTDKLTVSSAGITTAASLVATTADINAGTIDNSIIGGATPVVATFTTLNATTSNLGALGSNLNHANYNSTNVNIDNGVIDGTVIGSASAAAATFTTLDCTDGAFATMNLDIDGGTDIGAGLADADLFIVDDGAGGSNRKSVMSRIPTYLNNHANLTSLNAVTSASTLVTVGTIATGVWAATDVAVAHGGTGVSTLTDGGILLGSGTGAITATAVLGNGEILIGDGTTDPVALDVGSSSSITILGTIATGVWQGTTVADEFGGTGQSTWTRGDLLYASGANALGKRSLGAANTVLTSDGSDPVWGTVVNDMLAGGITQDKLATITSANKVSGSGIQLASTTAIEDNTGLQLKSAVAGTGVTLASQVLNVDASQTQVTAVGTLATGVWNATAIPSQYGGTGQNFASSTGVMYMASGTASVVDMTTKGILFVGDGSGAPSSLGVGSNTYLLAADSGEASGLKWVDPAALTVAVTALNGATESELVTVGSTITELDAEPLLTFNGTVFGCNTAAVFNEGGSNVDFRVEGTGAVNALFVDGATGNVGIGVGDPDQALEVAGIIHISTESTTPSAPGAGDGAYIYTKADGRPYWVSNDLSEVDLTATASQSSASDTDGDTKVHVEESADEDKIRFDTAGQERMIIDNLGKVAIGTTTPMNLLTLSHGNADLDNGILIYNETATDDNEFLGGIGFDSSDGNVPSSILEASAFIAAYAEGDHSNSNKGGDLAFGTGVSGKNEDVAATERMRILANGYIGMGVSNPDSALEILNTSTQLKLSYDATNYASFNIAADGKLNITTVDPDGAEADICLMPDGYVGIGITTPTAGLHQTFSAGSAYAASFNNTSSTGWGVFIKGGTNTGDPVLNVQDKDAASLLHVNAGGHIGMGTAAPVDALHIQDGNLVVMTNVANDGSFNALQLTRSKHATDGSHTAVDKDTVLGAIEWVGSDGDSFEVGTAIKSEAVQLWNNDARGSELQFYTTDKDTNILDQRMTIMHNGNVGIGTATPDCALHIEGATGTTSAKLIVGSGTGAFITIGEGVPDSGIAYIGWDNSKSLVFGEMTNDSDVAFAKEWMRISPSGKVGIGTDDPEAILDVKAGDTAQGIVHIRGDAGGGSEVIIQIVAYDSGNYGWIGTKSDADFKIGTHNFTRMHIEADGNVGIGTTDPDSKLHIEGSAAVITLNETSSNSATFTSFLDNGTEKAFSGLVTKDAYGGISGSLAGDAFIATHGSYNPNGRIVFAPKQVVKMVIDKDGNVGIGTADTGAKLTIIDATDSVSDTATYEDFALMLGHGSSVNGAAVGIAFHPSVSSVGTPGASIVAQRVGAYGVADLIFKTKAIGTAEGATLERMRILSSGNVGIGETSPAELLHIKSVSGDARILLEAPASSDAEIKFYEDSAVRYTIGYDDGTGNFVIGYDNVDAPWMSIGSTGKVGIGTTDPGALLEVASSTTNAVIKINANDASDSSLIFSEEGHSQWALYHISSGAYATQGDLAVYDFSDSSIAAYLSPGDSVWQSGSDERIKKDIENIDSVLGGINSLRPITWKRKYGKLGKVYAGLVAQEVIPHFPLVISGTEDSFKELPAKNAIVGVAGVTAVEAASAKDAVMGERQKVVVTEVEEEQISTEIVLEGGKYIQKTITKTVTKEVSTPQYEEVKLYDEDGEEIGTHQIPVMEGYEVESAVVAVEAVEAVEAIQAQEATSLSYSGGLSIGYSNFVPYLIKAIQELSAKVTALENA